jgi:alkylated DNA repair dioxygenase AlkB
MSLIDDPTTGCRVFVQHWLTAVESADVLRQIDAALLPADSVLDENTPGKWQRRTVEVFGTKEQPRHVYLCGEADVKAYPYSGKLIFCNPWIPVVKVICDAINKCYGTHFNSCLLNQYVDGRHNVGWHSDDEKHLGDNGAVVTLSLGANRKFNLAPKAAGHSNGIDLSKKISVVLTAGDICYMGGNTQKYWKHQIPQELKQKDRRVSLTFRQINFDGT